MSWQSLSSTLSSFPSMSTPNPMHLTKNIQNIATSSSIVHGCAKKSDFASEKMKLKKIIKESSRVIIKLIK